jgi:hypothetical protein
LVRNEQDVPHCPRCNGIELAKQFSVPAAAQTSGAKAAPLPICGTGATSYGCGSGSGQCRTGMCSLD